MLFFFSFLASSCWTLHLSCSLNTLRRQGRLTGRHLPKRPFGLQSTLTTQSALWVGGTRAVSPSMEEQTLGWAALLTALCKTLLYQPEYDCNLPTFILGAFGRCSRTISSALGRSTFEAQGNLRSHISFGQPCCNITTDKSASVGGRCRSPLPLAVPWTPSLETQPDLA